MTCTDLPYLEDLYKFLKSNEVLRECFPEIGSMEVFIDASDLDKLISKDCPTKKAVWIYPGSSVNKTSEKLSCSSKIVAHTLGLVVLKKCSKDHFKLEKDGDETVLRGDYMDLSCLRKKVIEEMACFESTKVDKVIWKSTGTTEVYGGWLSSTIEFSLTFIL